MSAFQVRRATSEDVSQLVPLWQTENLPAEELARRFTEFLVAVDEAGQVAGTVGLTTTGDQGELHSEAIGRFDVADELRALLWLKLRLICQGYGLLRLWTRLESPFWRAQGFHRPKPEVAERMPTEFGQVDGDWFALALKGDDALASQVEQHMGLLKAMNQADTERTRELAKRLKYVAGMALIIVAALIAIWSLTLFRLARVRETLFK